MNTDIILTKYLTEFSKNATLQQISIGCSGDNVTKIIKQDGIYFLKYSTNKQIQTEYKKLKWLQERLLVPEIISYEEQNDAYFLLTRALSGEMICTRQYMENWQTGLNIIQQAFDTLWNVDIADCPFDERIEQKLKHVKYKLDNNLVNPADIKPEFLEKHGGIDGMYKYLFENRPKENLCFSHGDTSLPNIFGNADKLTGFIDVSDCGVADVWFDIAVSAKSIKRNYGNQAVQPFYDFIKNKIGKLNYDAVEYYITLVEF